MNLYVNEIVQKQKQKQKEKEKNENNFEKNNRFLVNVNVIGSAGPIRFVVNEKDAVSGVIETSLKSYTKEGRLPILGTNANGFLLYPADGSGALNPSESIGSHRGRNFVLYKKQIEPHTTQDKLEAKTHKGDGNWKAWLNKSFNFKISSH